MTLDAKRRLANALDELLVEYPLSKINISLLVNKSGLSRRSFYNYFIDMYDFLFWMHDMRIQHLANIFWKERSYYQILHDCLCIIEKHHAFYKEAFKTEGPNSFSNSFIDMVMKGSKRLIGTNLTDDLEFTLKLYWIGATGQLSNWVEKDIPYTPKEMTMRLYNAMPESIRQYHPLY